MAILAGINGNFWEGEVCEMNSRDFERERRMLAEEMYLNYFNNYLYRNGVISKRDRDRMTVEIMHRKKSYTLITIEGKRLSKRSGY